MILCSLRGSKAICCLVLLSGIGSISRLSAATPIYVDNRAGSDSYNGRTPSHQGPSLGPVRSIQTALRRVSPGGTIILLPTNAPYTEDFTINKTLGSPRYPLVIEGNGVEFVGFQPINVEAWQHEQSGTYRLIDPNPLAVLIYSQGNLLTPSLSGDSPDRPSLEEGEWTQWKGTVYFRPGLKQSIDSYELSKTVRPAAIVVDRASNVVLRNFRIRGYGLDAIQVRGPAKGVRIEGCEIAQTVRAGVAAFTNVDLEVKGCRIAATGTSGVIVDNYVRLGLESVTIEESPERVVAGNTSTVDDRGGEALPIAKGPFIRPVGWRSHLSEAVEGRR